MTQKQSNQKINCWEYMKCERHPARGKVAELCLCPAAIFTALSDGQYHGGTSLGRRCWRMAGTLCAGEIQGTFAKKIQHCRACPFYQLVKKEEGEDFVE